MEKELEQQLEKVLSNHIDWFSSELKMFISENNLKGKLLFHCSSNASRLITCYISYSPNNDPAEESIDFCIATSLNSSTHKMDLLIDIYWSDGSQIQDLIDINNINLDKAVSRIDSIVEKSKHEILSAMKNQISIDRPPYYRKY